jgi:hypothetical protein
VAVSLHYDAAFYDCGRFLGIPYKNYNGSSWADIRLFFVVRDDFKIEEERREVTNSGHSSTIFGDIGAAILGMGRALSLSFGSLIATKVIAVVSLEAKVSDAGKGATGMFLAATSGVTSLQDLTKTIDMWQTWPLTTDPASSGLLPNETASPKFVLKQSTRVPSGYGVRAYKNRKAEIAYLRDLSNPSPRLHTVTRGESLWSITKATYEDPRIYLYVEDLNHLRRKRLPVGRQLQLPLLYEICAEMIRNDDLVRPGDSVFGIKQRRSAYNPKAGQFRSRSLNLIYPYEGILNHSVSTSAGSSHGDGE